jgi:hypothetical protein
MTEVIKYNFVVTNGYKIHAQAYTTELTVCVYVCVCVCVCVRARACVCVFTEINMH